MTLTTRHSRLFPADVLDAFGQNFGAVYGVDVREDADALYVEAELPGFKKDEVEVVLDKSTLTISAKHAETAVPTADAKPQQWLLRERTARSYQRAFRLPSTADGAQVAATLEDGVLRLTLTKREETKPRKIAVQ